MPTNDPRRSSGPGVGGAPYRTADEPEPEDAYYIQLGDHEKGPYTLKALQSSLKLGQIQPTAKIRRQGKAGVQALEACVSNTSNRRSHASPRRAFDPSRPYQASNLRRTGGVDLLGAGMVFTGVVMTGVTLITHSGTIALFVGLVVTGIARMVRGRR